MDTFPDGQLGMYIFFSVNLSENAHAVDVCWPNKRNNGKQVKRPTDRVNNQIKNGALKPTCVPRACVERFYPTHAL